TVSDLTRRNIPCRILVPHRTTPSSPAGQRGPHLTTRSPVITHEPHADRNQPHHWSTPGSSGSTPTAPLPYGGPDGQHSVAVAAVQTVRPRPAARHTTGPPVRPTSPAPATGPAETSGDRT